MGVSLYQFWGSIPSSKQRRHGCKCWGKIPPGVGVWSFSLCIFFKWYAQFSDTSIFTPGIDHCSDLFLSLGLHPPQEAPKFPLLEASSFLQNAQKKDGRLKMLDHDGSSIQIKSMSFPEPLDRLCMIMFGQRSATKMPDVASQHTENGPNVVSPTVAQNGHGLGWRDDHHHRHPKYSRKNGLFVDPKN